MMEIVFSFILNTWDGLSEVNAWAGDHLGGAHLLVSGMRKEGQILCALEQNRLLVYDTKWKKEASVKVPVVCHKGLSKEETLTEIRNIEFRSETLLSTPTYSAWDQKVDVQIKNQPKFSLFIRQDKKYVGAHSTAGWSMWIERKTGHLRYELIDVPNKIHFRLKAHGNVNPVKGGLTGLESIQALHVVQEQGVLSKAHLLAGKKADGFNSITYKKEDTKWTKALHKCETGKPCKDLIDIAIDEDKMNKFADVGSQKCIDFLEKGRPLAFDKVEPEQLVPPMALFR